jgi:hypothetical protein
MKIRLEGTKDEISWIVSSLEKVYSVTSKSKLYQNRDKTTYRCYLDIVPYWVRSGSILDSKVTLSDEPQPKPWDAVLGGENE